MVDAKTSRWIRASVNKHFEFATKQAQHGDTAVGDIPIIFENANDDLEKMKNEPRYIEVRLNGPRIRMGAMDEFTIDCEVSIMCNAMVTDDIYLIDRLVGIIQNAMIGFPVKKLGDGPDDDQSQLGCLVLREDVPRPIDTLQWGQLDTTRLSQSVVEGYYTIEI